MKDVIDELFGVFVHQRSMPRRLNQRVNKIEDAKNQILQSKHFAYQSIQHPQ